jgi:hypothetical protein
MIYLLLSIIGTACAFGSGYSFGRAAKVPKAPTPPQHDYQRLVTKEDWKQLSFYRRNELIDSRYGQVYYIHSVGRDGVLVKGYSCGTPWAIFETRFPDYWPEVDAMLRARADEETARAEMG